MKSFRVMFVVTIFVVLAVGCAITRTAKVEETEELCLETDDNAKEEFKVVFEEDAIPQHVRNEMTGVTIHENSHVGFEDLSYLTLTYVGYDGENHIGNMIVDRELADEVISIFKELYEIRFPIELMEPAYKFGGDDELSMENNNTSAFNDRPITGGTGLSYHQLGRAIDINPCVNPYVKKSVVLPASAEAYINRDVEAQGMINSDSECVRIFKKYGWTWGGNWRSLKDYQHFEKR